MLIKNAIIINTKFILKIKLIKLFLLSRSKFTGNPEFVNNISLLFDVLRKICLLDSIFVLLNISTEYVPRFKAM